MKAKARELSTIGWSSRPPEVIDVGVGVNLQNETGMSGQEIGALVVDVFHSLIDGGSNLLKIERGGKVTFAYVVRRGCRVEVGNRDDFEFLGWAAVCNLLDKQKEKTNGC